VNVSVAGAFWAPVGVWAHIGDAVAIINKYAIVPRRVSVGSIAKSP
jgi:hypothetical protein